MQNGQTLLELVPADFKTLGIWNFQDNRILELSEVEASTFLYLFLSLACMCTHTLMISLLFSVYWFHTLPSSYSFSLLFYIYS